MKGYSGWNYKPYRPADNLKKMVYYICRIEPKQRGFAIEWLSFCQETPMLYYRQRYKKDWLCKQVTGNFAEIDGLLPDVEYEIYLSSEEGNSRERLLKTGSPEGVVVNYLHPGDKQYHFSGQFPASPCIVRLPSGVLLASMDFYRKAGPQNLTIICRSEDDGETWRYVTDLYPCYWGKMFWHKNKLYMLSISSEYGDVLIGSSEDEGITWSEPKVLFRGSTNCMASGNHRGACIVTKHNGRLWTSLEYGAWHSGIFLNAVLSIDEDDDLLDAKNWTRSDFFAPDPAWKKEYSVIGAIEGNVIAAPDGCLVNVLRFGNSNKALMLKIDPFNPEEAPSFYKLIEFPMGHSKFEIIRHEDGTYYAIGNRGKHRNILSVYASRDLENWEFKKDLINCEDYSTEVTAFQYPSVILENDELLVLSRTAWNGASTFHDANYITFHRFSMKE